MTEPRAAGSSTTTTGQLTGRPGLDSAPRRRPRPGIPFYRCLHRTSARRPAPAIGQPNRERCTDCGALFDKE